MKNKPIEKYNHAIDAVRYHEMETVGLKKDTRNMTRIRV